MQEIKLSGIGILLCAAMFFVACDKDTHEDDIAPLITLFSPDEGAVFNSGDSIMVSFRIEENDELHRWDMELRRAADGVVLVSEGNHQHAQLLNVELNIQASVGSLTPCILWIQAEDHSGNYAVLERNISIGP